MRIWHAYVARDCTAVLVTCYLQPTGLGCTRNVQLPTLNCFASYFCTLMRRQTYLFLVLLMVYKAEAVQEPASWQLVILQPSKVPVVEFSFI